MIEDEVYPLRAGYSGKVPPEVAKAAWWINDFDGWNWQAIRQYLREHGVSGEECDSLTMMGVRMRCQAAAPKIVLSLGGTIATHTGTITRIEGDEPAGEPVLQATKPEARAFMDAKQWCTAAYAQQRYGITAQQLNRASKQENGLGGIIVNRSRAQVGEGKRGQVLVYHAGDLQRLANHLDHGE